jgi:serine/threonine protein kinase
MVALKVIDQEKCAGKEDLVQAEIAILKRLNHEHIVQLFDVWELDGSYYLSMELVSVWCFFDVYWKHMCC